MTDMVAAQNVYNAVGSWRASRNWQKWAEDNPRAWQVVQIVVKLEKERTRGRRKT